MLSIATFWFIVALASTYGHNNKYADSLRDDANLQEDLMPQELNPAFGAERDDTKRLENHFPEIQLMPIRPLLPHIARLRRSADADVPVMPETTEASSEPLAISSFAEQVKQYSRVMACFVLIMSGVIEIVVYVIQAYQGDGA